MLAEVQRQRKTGIIQLPASDVAVGHCVIVNEFDRPAGRFIAKITSINGPIVEAKYLHPSIKSSNATCVATKSQVMPVERFGVRVMTNNSVYWCERFGETEATYSDGEIRQWQDIELGEEYPYRG